MDRKRVMAIWIRHRFALTGLLYKAETPAIYLQFIAGVSAVVCLGGFISVRISKFYASRWQADACALIESEPKIKEWVKARTEPRISRPTFPRHASTVVRWSLLLVAVIWIWLVVTLPLFQRV
jgi:hypothetical protein